MATIPERRIITLVDSCAGRESESASDIKKNERQCVKYTNTWRRKWRFRSIGSSSLLLILTWQFIIRCSLGFTRHRTRYVFFEKEKEEHGSDYLWIVGDGVISVTTLLISCPAASLLAEVVISRYKLVSYSLKAMWLLSFVGSVISVCEDSLPVDKLHY